MLETLIAVKDPLTRDLLRAAFRERRVFRTAVTERERLPALLAPPCTADVVVIDLDPRSTADREALAALREINPAPAYVAVGPAGERSLFGPSKLELQVRTFVRTPVDAFDLARRLQRLAERPEGG